MEERRLLLDVIRNHDIKIEHDPFRHVVADNFFIDSFYNSLCKAFEAFLAKGCYETRERQYFSRFDGYDAYNLVIPPRSLFPLSVFYSREWKDYISNIFGIETSDEVATNFHHHKINSQDGFVHDDFNLCSFAEDRLENGINPWYHQCVYADDTWHRQPNTLKRFRTIVMIYYLNNRQWRDDDGGETGLYRSNDRNSLAKKVAPMNNRLLAYEISPASFHGFLKNTKSERNTLIQWFHQEPGLMLKRLGAWQPTTWKNRKPSIMDRSLWAYWRWSA